MLACRLADQTKKALGDRRRTAVLADCPLLTNRLLALKNAVWYRVTSCATNAGEKLRRTRMRTTWKTQTSVSPSKELVSNMTWRYYVFPRIQEFNCVSSDSSMEVVRIMTCTKEIEDTRWNPGKTN